MFNNKNIILSAHCDDAPLSLGGLMLGEKKKFVIIDFFATCAWSVNKKLKDSKKITEINLQEEKIVAKKLSAELSLYYFPEALLRKHKKWNSRKKTEVDRLISEKITKILLDKIGTKNNIYVPLAVGGHIDHKILHNSFVNLFVSLSRENKIFFYEDLPYSWYGGLKYKLKVTRKKFHLNPIKIQINSLINEKINILSLYKSQLNREHLNMVENYAKNIDGKNYNERIWYATQK